MRSEYTTLLDLEQQGKYSLRYKPTNSLKDRLFEFLDYYFGPLKLYLFSYPMPDGMWDNRKLRLEASGVQVIPRVEPPKIVERIIRITQKQPQFE